MRNKHLIKFAEEHGVTKKALGQARKLLRKFRVRKWRGNEFMKERILFADVWNKYGGNPK